MVDARETLKGGASIWQKIQIGAFGVIAISVLFITFLAWQTTRGTPGPDSRPPVEEKK